MVGAQTEAPRRLPELTVDAIKTPTGISDEQDGHRRRLWKVLKMGLSIIMPRASPNAPIAQVYTRATNVIAKAAAAFDLSRSSEKVAKNYGERVFGQGCLMLRRAYEWVGRCQRS